MVVSAKHNSEFIPIHTAAGYGRRCRENSDYHVHCRKFLGVAAGSSIVRRTMGRPAHGAGNNKQMAHYLLEMNLNHTEPAGDEQIMHNRFDPKTELSIIADNLPGGKHGSVCTTFCLTASEKRRACRFSSVEKHQAPQLRGLFLPVRQEIKHG